MKKYNHYKVFSFIVAILLSSLIIGQQNTQTYIAKVAIYGFTNNIIILTDNYNNPNQPFDNVFDKAFVLQTEDSIADLFIEFENNCEVIKYQNLLFINSCKDKYCFILQDVDDEQIETEIILYKGFGLAEYNISEFIEGKSLTSPGYVLANDINDKIKTNKCNNCASGGIGATSCSKSGSFSGVDCSCSVSCSTGYYACCATCEWCKCCKNTKKNLSNTNAQIKIYPNPTTSTLILENNFENNQVSNIIIYDLLKGQAVYESNNIYDTIDISNLKNGVYVITIIVEGELYSTLFEKIE